MKGEGGLEEWAGYGRKWKRKERGGEMVVGLGLWEKEEKKREGKENGVGFGRRRKINKGKGKGREVDWALVLGEE